MSNEELHGRWLLQLYYRYVGEPERMRDVYGYWLFLFGCLCGLAGIMAYLVEQAVVPGDLVVRQAAIVSAATGLAVALFGIVVLLPVRRKGILASLVGVLVAFVGIGLFWTVYPHAWYVGPDYSAEIIAVYGSGITIVAVVAVLVPIITGEKGLFVEPELGIGGDEPPILLGEATRDAFFAIFETPSKEWTWRMIQREAIAEGGRSPGTIPMPVSWSKTSVRPSVLPVCSISRLLRFDCTRLPTERGAGRSSARTVAWSPRAMGLLRAVTISNRP